MAVFKCKMCGGTLNIENGATVAECEFCGRKQTIPKLDDEKRANLYDRANHFRRTNDYDKAMGIYEIILNEDKTDAEAYWSILLCKFGVEYVEDPATHKRVPTINRTQFTSILKDVDYKNALKYADGYQRDIYEEEAREIDKIQKGILAISGKEDPFDVFICYKETDHSGRRTIDSVLAQDLYHNLKNEGLKVFFSRITLEDKLGVAYEPYIFAALNSAKVMVVIGSKLEYFNAVWVKNEWSRYLSLIRNGEKKTLIPAYKDMDPYDLPEEFTHLQAQDMNKLGFMQDLVYGIKKIIGRTTPKTVVKETVVVDNHHDTAPLLRRAYLFLEDGDFDSANEYAEKVLDSNPECAEAYFIKLLAEVGIRKPELLLQSETVISEYSNYKRALRFADNKFGEELSNYNDAILDNIENRKKESIYQSACELLEDARYLEAIETFEEIIDYKDSASKIGKCNDLIETERKEMVYNNAISRVSMSNASDVALKQSISALQSISGYKNADGKVAELQARLEKYYHDKRVAEEQAKIRAEEERLRKLREAELRKIKAEKRKQKIKKTAKIGIPSILALTLVLVLTFTLFIPLGKYNKANYLLNSGKYEEAIKIYEDLGGFSGSEAKIATINAIKTIENGSFEQGVKDALTAGAKVNVTYNFDGGNFIESRSGVNASPMSCVVFANEQVETEKTYTYTKIEDFKGLKTPERSGYYFQEWELVSCSANVTSNNNTLNLRLIAMWSANQYVITYNLYGGSIDGLNPTGYNPDDNSFTLINPTRRGYSFIGWTGTDLEEKTMNVTISSGSYGNRSYTANWQANTYNVTYDANGGTALKTQDTATYDQDFILATVERKGYKFIGWKADNKIYTSGDWTTDKNITLVAEWEIINYKINYNLDGGTTTNVLTYTVLDDVTLSEPEKTGYSFDGWTFEGQDEPTKTVFIPTGSIGEKNYTAHWSANSYDITYDANNGIASKTSDTAIYDDYFTLATVERKGYKFLGWFDGSQKVVSGDWKIANDVTLKAEWEIINYEITYNLDGGTSTNTTSYTILESIALEEPTKIGYSFVGWTYNGQTIPTKTVTILAGTIGEKEYTAHWSANSYGVTYLGNGGEVSKENDTFVYDSNISLPSATRIGYNFVGWYNDKDKVESGKWKIAENVTLTAEWEIITYSISYNMNYGTTTNRTSYTVETDTFSLFEPTKPVCIFLGWTFAGQDTPIKDVIIAKGTIGNKIFTAHWEDCLTYSLDTSSNAYTVTGYASGHFIADLEIPSTYNGKPIKSIGMCAFQGSSIKSVVIPDTVVDVYDQAFYNCQSLESVHFGSSVKKIYYAVFRGCDNLTSVEFSNSIEYIGRYAFESCNLKGTITLPSSLTQIGNGAFGFNFEMEKVYIPKSVKIMGDYVFDNSGEYIGWNTPSMSALLEIYVQSGTDRSGWSSKWNYCTTGYVSRISLIYTW